MQVKHTQDVLPNANAEMLVMCIGVTSGISRLIFGKVADLPNVNRIRMQQVSATMGWGYRMGWGDKFQGGEFEHKRHKTFIINPAYQKQKVEQYKSSTFVQYHMIKMSLIKMGLYRIDDRIK